MQLRVRASIPLLTEEPFFVLYAVTGENACARRASALWNVSRVFALLGFNLLVWGHVAWWLWSIWRK